MGISALLGFLSLVGWVLVVAGAAIAIMNASLNRQARPWDSAEEPAAY